MDAAIDVKTLEEAVTVFYRSGAQQQSAAHDWLTKAQLSPQAWSFVWDLMQLGKVSSFSICSLLFISEYYLLKKFTLLFLSVIRDSILWSHNIAHKITKTLARSAEGESR